MSWLSSLNFLDWLICGIGAVAFLRGLSRGASQQVLALIALGVAALAAVHGSRPLAASAFLSPLAEMSHWLARGVAFVAIFAVCWTLWRCLAAAMVARLREMEGVGPLDRLAGGLLGVVECALVLGALLWAASTFDTLRESSTYANSQLGSRLGRGFGVALSSLPGETRQPLEDWASELDHQAREGELIISLERTLDRPGENSKPDAGASHGSSENPSTPGNLSAAPSSQGVSPTDEPSLSSERPSLRVRFLD